MNWRKNLRIHAKKTLRILKFWKFLCTSAKEKTRLFATDERQRWRRNFIITLTWASHFLSIACLLPSCPSLIHWLRAFLEFACLEVYFNFLFMPFNAESEPRLLFRLERCSESESKIYFHSLFLNFEKSFIVRGWAMRMFFKCRYKFNSNNVFFISPTLCQFSVHIRVNGR